MRKALITFAIVMFCARLGWPQAKLSEHWEELTAATVQLAVEQSQGHLSFAAGNGPAEGPI